jgi:uncharacterized membrane protein HdeD (DUF308 family)
MENDIFGNLKRTVKYWYLPLILGILFILIGIWIFMTPVASYFTLSVLFAFTFLFAGIIEVIYSISNRKYLNSWGWTLVSGIIGLLFGILLLATPEFSLLTLGLLVGISVFFYSIIALGRSFELRKYKVDEWGFAMIISIIGLILGILMIWNPLFGGFTIVIYTAISFITLGIFQIYLSNRLRKLRKQIQD